MVHIYKITNKLNGKQYVGQTVNKINLRFNQHVSYAKRTKESLAAVTAAKVGKNNPNYGKKAKRVICEHCSKDVANNIYVQYHGNNCKSLKSRV